MSRYEDFGRGRHYEDLNPAGFDPHERVKVLDAEGIDVSVMYPGPRAQARRHRGSRARGVVVPRLQRLARRSGAAAAPDRLKGVGALPMQDPAGAAEEAHRIKDLGLVGTFVRPNAYNGIPFHHPHYKPVWEALEETGLPFGMHIAGLADMPGASRAMGSLMAPGTHHTLIPVIDQMVTLSNLTYGGVLEKHPDLKVVVLESGGGWIAHWMDRLNEFEESYSLGRGADVADARGVLQAPVLDQLRPGRAHAGSARHRWSVATATSGRPTSRTTTRSIPAWSTSCASTTTRCPTARAGASTGSNALDLYGIPHPSIACSRRRCSICSSRAAPSSTAPARRRAPPTSASATAASPRSARSTTTPTRTIDADGLLVTPGFVDIHTHYDAQLHWDPTASPASWHGVTTLLTGNCGFTIAPAKPDDLEWLLLMLSRVEGMSADALAAGVTFRGGSLGDFLGGLDGAVGVNVGANVGHCAVRRYVMGDDASERTATDDEIAAMQELVRAAMRDGAIGFTSSQLELHVAHDGRGVPSNHAAPEELVALAGVLKEFGRGSIEFIPRTFLNGYSDDDRALMLAMARARRDARCTSTRSPRCRTRPRAGRAASSSPRPRRPTASRSTRCSRRTGRVRTSRSAPRSCSTRCRPSATRSRCRRRHARSACAIPRCASRCGSSSPTRAAARSCSCGRSSRSRW